MHSSKYENLPHCGMLYFGGGGKILKAQKKKKENIMKNGAIEKNDQKSSLFQVKPQRKCG